MLLRVQNKLVLIHVTKAGTTTLSKSGLVVHRVLNIRFLFGIQFDRQLAIHHTFDHIHKD